MTGLESDINELKIKGNEAYANKKYEKAINIYREAITLDPNNPVLYSNRAMAFIKVGNWDMALRDSDLGLNSIGNDLTQSTIRVKLLWRKAVALRHKNDLNGAEKILTEAENISPNNKSVLSEKKILSEEISAFKKRKFENGIISSKSDTNKSSPKPLNLHQESQSEIGRTTPSLMSNNSEAQLATDFLSPVKVSRCIKHMEQPEISKCGIRESAKLPDTSLDIVDNKILDLEIVVVDQLPTDFFNQKAVQSDFESDLTKLADATTPVKVKAIEHISYSDKFPKQPTSYFLSSLGRKNQDKIKSYYSSILQLSSEYYKTIFKVTGVEADFLEFYVDAAIDDLQKPISSFESNISDQIILFSQLPRFIITSMYIPLSKVKKLMDLIYFKTGKDLKSYWK